jgi:hypothetical protein
MVEHQLPKLNTGVRFPVPALYETPGQPIYSADEGSGLASRLVACRVARPRSMPLCVKGQFRGVWGRVEAGPLALGLVVVLGLVSGPGSDLSESLRLRT